MQNSGNRPYHRSIRMFHQHPGPLAYNQCGAIRTGQLSRIVHERLTINRFVVFRVNIEVQHRVGSAVPLRIEMIVAAPRESVLNHRRQVAFQIDRGVLARLDQTENRSMAKEYYSIVLRFADPVTRVQFLSRF